MDEEESIYNTEMQDERKADLEKGSRYYRKYMYTFEPRCKEVSECILADDTTRIFLNTKGEKDDEISKDIIDFLHYIENTTNEVAENSGSEQIKRIHDRVCKVKSNKEIGVKFMQAWEEKYYERQAGKEEGLKNGQTLKLIDLVCKKLARNLTVSEISDILEENEDTIQKIAGIAIKYAPDYKAEEILSKLTETPNDATE